MKVINKENSQELLSNSKFYKQGVLDLSSLEQLTKIEAFAFAAQLKQKIFKVILPKNLEEIEFSAFMSNDISEVVFNSNLKKIGTSAFESNKISQLNLNSKISVIENSAFGFNKIKNLVIKENITEIEEDAFISNEIETITFENPYIELYSNPFWENKNITTLIFKNTKNLVFLNQKETTFKTIELNHKDFKNNTHTVEFEFFNLNYLFGFKEFSNVQKIVFESEDGENEELKINFDNSTLDSASFESDVEIEKIVL
ncbi:leucine-rich repeat domain-containing protein [Mycoplasma procyoni]|uniref:leucine-rich repeat domain-containing protein n=1 Tax=Mycoplasma procyoni TaxID=568784 RepID=UPI00197C9F28|nr:leucine-rich repeat domain-containing protein [Mycoplasma procyoni]MBN3534405.1 leucine-rich repeat domain-containing protein [Mycoplasma procyoni]